MNPPLPRLLEIAKSQRAVMLCILASTGVAAMNAFVRPEPMVSAVATLVVMTVSMVFTIRLARMVLSNAAAIACAALLLAPAVIVFVAPRFLVVTWFAALITLLVVNGRATKEIRAAGFRVGLLGGDPVEIESRMRGR